MLKQKAYRDVYVDLNGIPDTTKVFISDLGANGLRFKRENNQPYDTVDVGGKTISFDGDWGKAKISEQEYTKTWQYVRRSLLTDSAGVDRRAQEALVASAPRYCTRHQRGQLRLPSLSYNLTATHRACGSGGRPKKLVRGPRRVGARSDPRWCKTRR